MFDSRSIGIFFVLCRYTYMSLCLFISWDSVEAGKVSSNRDRDQDSQSGGGSPKLQRKATQAGSQSLGTKNSASLHLSA